MADISGIGTTGSTIASSFVDNPNSVMGKTDFLELLITKLRFQDPLKPMSDESFIADMAQFSSLEQMNTMNSGFTQQTSAIENLNDNLIGLMLMQNTSQAASLIGKNVTVAYSETDLATGQLVEKTTAGVVDVVRFVDGQPKIVVGGNEYYLSAVKEISA